MTTIHDLEARLAELEARLGPAPLAVPPIVIGSIADAPQPGSPIASNWANEITNRIVHRFATVAARDAAWPASTAGVGSVCITLDTNTIWVVSNAAVWISTKPSGGASYGITFYSTGQVGNVILTTTPTVNLAVNLPALPAGTLMDISYTAYVNCQTSGTGGGQSAIELSSGSQTPSCIWSDGVQLSTYSAKMIGIPIPVTNNPFTVAMKSNKFAAGGTVQLQSVHTYIGVTTYRP